MSDIIVSVVIPTYNRLYALAELLESLSRQSYQSFEVIIVNDAGEPVDELLMLYKELKIKIINQENNIHHVQARNIGVTHARADWIMLIDDDDLLLPFHIEQMVEESKGYDLVYTDVEIVNYQSIKNTRHAKSRFLFAYTYDLEAMRKFSTYVPSGSLFRKQTYEQLGGFDPAMRNYWDWDFFLRVADKFQVKRVPVASVLYAFSDTGDNQSSQLSVMRTYLDRLCEKHNLGHLPTKNFFLLLEEDAVKERQATSEVRWDGKPTISRLLSKQ